MRLYHISDQPGIGLFEPRTGGHGFEDEAVVWAIDEEHLPNYLLPRDCPRVTFFAREDSDPEDIRRLMCGGSASRVIAVEWAWLERIRAERLHCYEIDSGTFARADEIAGYYVSRDAVKPTAVREIDDVLSELARCDVELRLMPSLWQLREEVIGSSLSFSIIRMRNAGSTPAGFVSKYPLPTPR